MLVGYFRAASKSRSKRDLDRTRKRERAGEAGRQTERNPVNCFDISRKNEYENKKKKKKMRRRKRRIKSSKQASERAFLDTLHISKSSSCQLHNNRIVNRHINNSSKNNYNYNGDDEDDEIEHQLLTKLICRQTKHCCTALHSK